MSESKTEVIRLNGKNYATWKIQCRIALVKDSLWSIVSGDEETPAETDSDQVRRKFANRKDRGLAIIVLAIDPSLLYLVGADPKDPKEVWDKLEKQFQKKTWWNKFQMRKKLYSAKLQEGVSVDEHLKVMTETFDSLAVMGAEVGEADKVGFLLASLPSSYNTLVMAIQGQSEEAPSWDLVTQRLIQEELRQKDRGTDASSEALYAGRDKPRFSPITKKELTCHYCGKKGHFQRECRKLARAMKSEEKSKESGNTASVKDDGMLVAAIDQALSAKAGINSWIVDSGATSHNEQ